MELPPETFVQTSKGNNRVFVWNKLYRSSIIKKYRFPIGTYAEDIYFKFGKKPYLYTYGSVKPFYGKKTYEYVKQCCTEAYNFKFKEDIVGYMVPFFG